MQSPTPIIRSPNSENAYGAFIHTAMHETFLQSFRKCGAALLICRFTLHIPQIGDSTCCALSILNLSSEHILWQEKQDNVRREKHVMTCQCGQLNSVRLRLGALVQHASVGVRNVGLLSQPRVPADQCYLCLPLDHDGQHPAGFGRHTRFLFQIP